MSDRKGKHSTPKAVSATAKESKAKWKSRLYSYWRDWRAFVIFVILMLLFRSAIADWNHVPSGSMNPGILEGDRLVVDKIAYDIRWPFSLYRISRWGHPERGDIVTFPSPESEKDLLIKRVVGIPGDIIEVVDNHLVINGVEATYEPLTTEEVDSLPMRNRNMYDFVYEELLGDRRVVMWAKRRSRDLASRNFGPEVVPDGCYFMMGDNRDRSRDSRSIGFIERRRVIGRAHTVAFSLDTGNYWMPRMRRFFTELM